MVWDKGDNSPAAGTFKFFSWKGAENISFSDDELSIEQFLWREPGVARTQHGITTATTRYIQFFGSIDKVCAYCDFDKVDDAHSFVDCGSFGAISV